MIHVHNARRRATRAARIKAIYLYPETVSFDTTIGRLGPYPVDATMNAKLR